MSGASQVSNGKIDLNGMSCAQRLAVGTTEVVSAVANTKGIKVALAAASANAGTADVQAGGTYLVRASTGTVCHITNVKVPPGVNLEIATNSTSAAAWVWYEVL